MPLRYQIEIEVHVKGENESHIRDFDYPSEVVERFKDSLIKRITADNHTTVFEVVKCETVQE